MHFGWWPDQSGFGWVMMIMMVAFWGLIVGGLVLLVRSLAQDAGRGSRGEDRALQLARLRYAKGEISTEEYERVRAGLAT